MSPTYLLLALLLLVLAVFKIVVSRPRMPATAAHQAVRQGTAVLVDVREPAEWRDGVAAPAALLPLSDLRGPRRHWRPFLDAHRGKQLLVYCHSGMRSAAVTAQLRREGFDAVNLGGFHTWTSAGLPVRRVE